jgi:hypothetical protein
VDHFGPRGDVPDSAQHLGCLHVAHGGVVSPVPGYRDERDPLNLELDELLLRDGVDLRRDPLSRAVEHVAGKQHRIDLVLDRELHDHRERVLLIAQPVAGLAAVLDAGAQVQIAETEKPRHATTRSECSSSTWSTYQTSSCQASCPSRFTSTHGRPVRIAGCSARVTVP